MKSTLLFENHGLRCLLLVMDRGDEACEQISTFARNDDVTAASLTAIGAAERATLGYFDPKTNKYLSTDF